MGNKKEEKETLEDKIQTNEVKTSAIKNYIIDTSAALSFWTPIMTSIEYFGAGMDSEEVLKSRLAATTVHMTIARPYGKLRQWVADKMGANTESSQSKKFAIDTLAMISTQAPLYAGILYFSGASLQEVVVALPTGLAVGAVSGRPYGYCLDKWRKLWGTKTTF